MSEAVVRTFYNPIITDNDGADHGDPFVMKFLDQYYLYHTGKQGIKLYKSANLVDWEYLGIALQANTAADHWAQYELWAPEVMYRDGVFYMYVAGTKLLPNGRGDDQARRLGIARSSTPEGPFVWDDTPLVPWEWSIDGHPYQDADGSLWLFYNIRTEASRYPDGTTGCGNVVDRLLAPDKLEEVQDVVTFPTERWEGNAEGTWYWNEGPCVLKRHGVYYQMYSGGCYRDGTYAVGYATAPTPRGPWAKYAGNPILHTKEGILGPGHHCVVKAPDGVTPYNVYHGYLPNQKGRKVHTDRLYWAGDKLMLAGPTVGEQSLPPGAVYDPQVPCWHADAWVCAPSVRVNGVVIHFASCTFHHVQAVFSYDNLRVNVDGVNKYVGAMQPAQPDITANGEVQSLTVTTWLDDEEVYSLQAGEIQRWPWGGSTDVEVQLAIRGRAVVRVQGASNQCVQVQSPDAYRLVQLRVQGGIEVLAVEAESGGAKVTDVVITAR